MTLSPPGNHNFYKKPQFQPSFISIVDWNLVYHFDLPASTIAGLLLGQTESTLSTRLVVQSSFS